MNQELSASSPAVGAADIDALTNITRRLTDLLTAEIAALRGMRPKDIVPLQDEKAALTDQYQRLLQKLKEQGVTPGSLDPASAIVLKESTALLNDVIVNNKRAIEAVKIVNERVLHIVAEEIARQRNPAHAYTGDGQLADARAGAARRAGPLRLDAHV